MGFFDIFKKRKEILEVKKVRFEELSDWVNEKNSEISAKETEFANFIKSRLSSLVNEINIGLSELEKIDLKEKKAEEKLKFIVKENLNNYIVLLTRLIEKLRNFDEEKPEQIIKKINLIFSDFEKRSSMNFHKATILIGDELGRIKASIGNFFRDTRLVIDKNKKIIEDSKTLSEIKSQIEEIKKIDKFGKESNKRLLEIDEIVGAVKKDNNKISLEVENIKKSIEYAAMLEKRAALENKKKDLLYELDFLRSNIDFKALAKIFHKNEKQMQIIKDYSSKFNETFSTDNGERLMSLFDKNDKNHVDTIEGIEKIRKMKEELKNIQIEEDETIKLEMKIKANTEEIEKLKGEKEKEPKKQIQFSQEKQEIMGKIKEELKKFNIEVEN